MARWQTEARGLAIAAVVSWACLAGGCADPLGPTELERADRYGVFRDLVWIPREDRRDGGYFLDRFETTQADWRRFAIASGQSEQAIDDFFERWRGASRVDPVLPVVGVNLAEARAFARWRFGRLQRYDEWDYAATARGRYRLPWGNLPRAAYANTVELGHFRLTPVGMFESARYGDGPFDLIGNAGEWTESVSLEWHPSGFESTSTVLSAAPALRAHPALRAFHGWFTGPTVGGVIDVTPVPAWLLVQWRRDRVPRLAVGGADRPMLGGPALLAGPLSVMPRERSSLLGIRVAAEPVGILRALLAESAAPDPASRRSLEDFLRRHAGIFDRAWATLRGSAEGPLAPILRAELGS